MFLLLVGVCALNRELISIKFCYLSYYFIVWHSKEILQNYMPGVLHVLAFFYIEIFTNEERQNAIASQDTEMHFGFGSQLVPRLADLLYTE
jgi:hypothetical protein